MTYEEKALREKAFDIETKEDLLSLLNDIKADLTHESSYPFTMQTMMRYSRPGVYSWRYNICAQEDRWSTGSLCIMGGTKVAASVCE